MADTKITALTAITTVDPAVDVLPIVDVSDTSMAASGTTKKITSNQILGAGGTATLASATITGDLTVKTNVLKVDTTNNRVGVNNSSPSTNLHVGSGVGLNNLGVGLSRGATTNFYEAFDGTKSFLAGTDSSQTGVKVGALSNHSMFLVCNNITQLQIDPLGVFSFTDGAGGTRMTLNSTGLGVGVTPSAWAAGYKALQLASSQSTALMGSGNQTELTTNAFYDGAWKYQGAGTVAASRYSQQSGVHYWYSAAAGAANATITDFASAKMTLDASGNLLVGTTTAAGKITALAGASGQASVFQQPAQNFWCVLAHNQATSGDNSFVLFGTEASFTSRGSITYNRAGGLVAYNTTSDYRAKDIIGSVSNSGSLIDSLKVYVGKMKGATIERPMLIAHEAQEIAPYAVTGTKDEVDADGNPKYQQMDASALVPLLIAEIQSLRARVQTLETR